MNAAVQWSDNNAASASQGVKVLAYGGSGVGKTSLVATAPAPCLISAEAGTLSLRRKNIERMFGVNTPGIAYEIPVMQVSNIDQLTAAYMYFATDASARQYFQTICLDSLTEIGEVVLANAKKTVKDPRQAYGELIEKVTQLIKGFRDLAGYHVYMSAKMESIDTGHGVVKSGPSMPGSKLGPSLPYLFDEVFRVGVSPAQANVPGYRYIQTQEDLQHTAKDRSGALDQLEPPNLTHIFNKILGD